TLTWCLHYACSTSGLSDKSSTGTSQNLIPCGSLCCSLMALATVYIRERFNSGMTAIHSALPRNNNHCLGIKNRGGLSTILNFRSLWLSKDINNSSCSASLPGWRKISSCRIPSLNKSAFKAAASSFLDRLNCQTLGETSATSFRLRVRTLGLLFSSCSTSLRANGPTTILVFLLTCCLSSWEIFF